MRDRLLPSLSRLDATATFRLFVFLVLAIHAAKVLRLLPVQTLADGRPLVEYSHSAAFSEIGRDRDFAKAGAGLWGYDPYVSGGMYAGVGINAETVAPVLFDRLIRFAADPATSGKIFTALALMAAPLFLLGAALMFGYDRRSALTAMALLTATFISHDQLGRDLIQRGQEPFWLGCFVALFNGAALYSTALGPSRRHDFAFLLSYPLLLVLDPLLAGLQLVPIAVILLVSRGARARIGLLAAAAVGLAFVLNRPWFVPYVQVRLESPPGNEWSSDMGRAALNYFLPTKGYYLWRLNALIRLMIVLYAVAELFTFRPDRRRLIKLMWPWLAALVLVALEGVRWPVTNVTDPGRALFAATSLLLIPAGARIARQVLVPGTTRQLVFLWLLWVAMTWQLVHKKDPAPLRADLTPREQRLLGDLRRLPADGRVLVQYGPLFTDVLRIAPLDRRHLYVGFSGPWWRTAHGTDATFARLGDTWLLFGKPLTEYNEETLLAALRAFNVHWVVATAPTGQNYFATIGALTEVDSDGKGAYSIYEVPSPGTYLHSGAGTLTFGFNGLHIKDAAAGRIVTGFRLDGPIVAAPPCTVETATGAVVTTPFIAINNPGRREVEVYARPR